jgi:hypothetical protein
MDVIELTPSSIMFVLGLLGLIFTIYLYFKNPQDKLDKKQAVIEKDVADRATTLAQQLQWEKESTERRFKELNDHMCAANALAQNHIHTIDTKMDSLTVAMNIMNVEMGKLRTTIEERLPSKNI